MTIHWCATAPVPEAGLAHLAGTGQPVVIWRTAGPAWEAVPKMPAQDLRDYCADALRAAVRRDDLVISALGAAEDLSLAAHCLERRVHFVCASAATPALEALADIARGMGVTIAPEAGLAPGIDHILARQLFAAYRADPAYAPRNVISFSSFCGRVPSAGNALRAKFHTAPVELLQSLLMSARSIRAFAELAVTHPWDAVTELVVPTAQPETFEAYPTGDSLALKRIYGLDPEWPVRQFARGTLQLKGWSAAWEPIFAELAGLAGPEAAPGEAPSTDAGPAAIAKTLAQNNPYAEGEADRVVVFVSLLAQREGVAAWHRSWVLEAGGDFRGPAVQRLEALSLGLAGQAVLARDMLAGLHVASEDAKIVARWMEALPHQAHHLNLINHLR